MDFLKRQSSWAEALPSSVSAMLVTYLPNVRYLCGFTGSSGVLAMVRTSRVRKAAFFTDGRYTEQAAAEVKGAQVIIAKCAAISSAVDWLAKQSVKGLVGFEAEHVTVAARAGLQKASKGRLRFAPTTGVVERLRAVKEPAEVQQLRAAVVLGCKVFEAIVPGIKAGMAETSVAA